MRGSKDMFRASDTKVSAAGRPEVQLLTHADDTAEFIVYTALVSEVFLRRFAEPAKAPPDASGLDIEYTKVPIWPLSPDGNLQPDLAACSRSFSLTGVPSMRHCSPAPCSFCSLHARLSSGDQGLVGHVRLSDPTEQARPVLAWESSFSRVRAPKCSSVTAALASVMFPSQSPRRRCPARRPLCLSL